MARQEFKRQIKVEVVKRATRESVVYCELCGLPAKKFQIDHIVADAHGGKAVIENAQLICEPCYSVKNAKDTTIAAKIKRQEAQRLGVSRQKQKIQSRGFDKKPRPEKLPMLPPREIFR